MYLEPRLDPCPSPGKTKLLKFKFAIPAEEIRQAFHHNQQLGHNLNVCVQPRFSFDLKPPMKKRSRADQRPQVAKIKACDFRPKGRRTPPIKTDRPVIRKSSEPVVFINRNQNRIKGSREHCRLNSSVQARGNI